MHLKPILTGLALASLLGCSTFSAPPVPTPVKLLPPVELLQSRAEPDLLGDSNADLAEWALALRAVVRALNADKASLREWADGS